MVRRGWKSHVEYSRISLASTPLARLRKESFYSFHTCFSNVCVNHKPLLALQLVHFHPMYKTVLEHRIYSQNWHHILPVEKTTPRW